MGLQDPLSRTDRTTGGWPPGLATRALTCPISMLEGAVCREQGLGWGGGAS